MTTPPRKPRHLARITDSPTGYILGDLSVKELAEYITGLEAEAERLEEKFAVASLFVKGALEQKIQAEAERDEARDQSFYLKRRNKFLEDNLEALRARVAELEAARETDQERMDAVNEVQALRAQVAELEAKLDSARVYVDLLENCQDGYYHADRSDEAVEYRRLNT